MNFGPYTTKKDTLGGIKLTNDRQGILEDLLNGNVVSDYTANKIGKILFPDNPEGPFKIEMGFGTDSADETIADRKQRVLEPTFTGSFAFLEAYKFAKLYERSFNRANKYDYKNKTSSNPIDRFCVPLRIFVPNNTDLATESTNENKMAYIIKITDLTGEGKPDLYYAEPRDMRRALVADINQAKKYATEEEAYDEIDDSDVAELVIDYGYYNWESDKDGNVDFVDKVPGDAIDIITESKSLKDIRNQMKRLTEDINMSPYNDDKRYVINSSDGYIQLFKTNVYEVGDMYIEYTNNINLAKAYSNRLADKIANRLNEQSQDPESEVFGMKFWVKEMDNEEYLSWMRDKERRHELYVQLANDL